MPITWHNKYKFAIFASREFGNQSSIAREAILHKKKLQHSFIHSFSHFIHESHYVSNTRMFTNIRDSLASTSTCVCWSRDRERIQSLGARAQKIRHVCSISQLLCRVLCNDHTPSPPHTITTVASCHSQVEWDQTTISVAKYPRQSHVIRLCCMQYIRGAWKYHVLFIAGDMRLNNIRTISRKGKINSIKRPFLLVCLNISLDRFP